ncbi:MAG TPA: hypothetical protein VEJ45_02185 [Candidatus Acidoferrales bacterium]|nr:hypothetical protein [Candidatus Acidoferrales bacterium]
MMLRSAVVAALLVSAFAVSNRAADISGQWTATFNTQVGEQHYVYTFKVDGEKLTGTAKSDNGTSEIQNGTVKGDNISFVENLEYQGQKLTITYTGKVSGDEIHFTRDVSGFATEELVAKRVN